MLGFIMAVIAGAAMSVQGVMNTRLNEKIGLLEANAFVQGTAFLLSALAVLCFGRGNFAGLRQTGALYWLGGVLGLVITVTVMLSIQHLSPTVAIGAILVSQLLVAALIDALGLMETPRAAFTWQKYVGTALMIGGVVLFKMKPS